MAYNEDESDQIRIHFEDAVPDEHPQGKIGEEEAEADVDDQEDRHVIIQDHTKIKKIKYFKEKRHHPNGYSSSGRDEQWSSVHH